MRRRNFNRRPINTKRIVIRY